MTYQFKITVKQQLLLLIPFLTMNSVIVLFCYYLFREMSLDALVLFLFIFVFVFFILPPLVIHLQYLGKNWKATVRIDNANKIITYQNNKGVLQYSFADIENLKYYATYGHISTKGRSLWYTFDPYRFYQITFKNEKKVIITCLMILKIDWNNY